MTILKKYIPILYLKILKIHRAYLKMFVILVTLSPATSQRQTDLPFSVDISLTKILYANKIELHISMHIKLSCVFPCTYFRYLSLLHSCFTWWLMYLEDHFAYFRQLSTSGYIEVYMSFSFLCVLYWRLLLFHECPPDQDLACFSDMICGYKWYSDNKCVLALICNVGEQQQAKVLEWDR